MVFASNWKDLPDTHMYTNQLEALYDNGVIRGYPDGTVKPDQVMNRVEALKIILQAMNAALSKNPTLDGLNFSDVGQDDVDAWYFPYITFAVKYGYMSGYSDGTFRKNDTMTRAEFLKVLMKAKKIKPVGGKDIFDDIPSDHWVKPYVDYLYERDMLSEEFNNLKFKPDEPITRALASFFTYQLFYRESEEGESQSDDNGESPAEDLDENSQENSGISDLQKHLVDRGLHDGVASYYGNSFTGRGTASGEKFDNAQNMAAHPYLPFGSIIKITNKANGNSVESRVVDCGPFVKGRVIDLSQSAFAELGSLSAGLLRVTVEVVSLPEGKPFQQRCYDLRVERVGEE